MRIRAFVVELPGLEMILHINILIAYGREMVTKHLPHTQF